jgi:hypothetical protein
MGGMGGPTQPGFGRPGFNNQQQQQQQQQPHDTLLRGPGDGNRQGPGSMGPGQGPLGGAGFRPFPGMCHNVLLDSIKGVCLGGGSARGCLEADKCMVLGGPIKDPLEVQASGPSQVCATVCCWTAPKLGATVCV